MLVLIFDAAEIFATLNNMCKSAGTSGKRCPKGYISVTVGGTPTDAKKQEKSPEVVILVIKRHSLRIHVLK